MNEDISMYRLVVLKGAESDFRTVIRESSVLIGRDEKCRVCLPDPSLALQHMALRLQDGQVLLQVLQGADPVVRAGEPLTGAVLSHGDVLEMGDLHLQFQVVRPLPFHPVRLAGPTYRIAGMGLGAILVLECLLVGWLWYEGPRLTGGTRMVAEEPGPDPDARTHELDSTRAQLDGLQARQGEPSPEDIWASGGSVELAQEIQQVRARVSLLDTRLDQLMGADPEGAAILAESGDLVSRRLLRKAQRAIAAGEFEAADEYLGELLDSSPDNISAYMTRARLRERMGQPEAAIAQWDEVIRLAVDPTVREDATADRVRLQRDIRQAESRMMDERERERAALINERRALEARREMDQRRLAEEQNQREAERIAEEKREEDARLAQEKAAREKTSRERAERERAEQQRLAEQAAERERARQAVAQAPKVVQIDAVRREKFQNRENYEEIRLIRIEVKRRKSGGPIRRDQLRIEVEFFDKDPATGAVQASRVPAPQKGLNLEEDWIREEMKSFSALYMVPRGFRKSERERTGRTMQFHGYVVRIFYTDQLQDEHAFPGALLQN